MSEAACFEAFVWGVAAGTAARLARARDGVTAGFLGLCVLGQACAIAGLGTGDARAVCAGHYAFTGLLWVGVAVLPRGPELALCGGLAAFTLVTRHALGHCMFSHARGSAATNDARYDLLYAVPLLVALRRATRGDAPRTKLVRRCASS